MVRNTPGRFRTRFDMAGADPVQGRPFDSIPAFALQ
jgi:hypothetical protein